MSEVSIRGNKTCIFYTKLAYFPRYVCPFVIPIFVCACRPRKSSTHHSILQFMCLAWHFCLPLDPSSSMFYLDYQAIQNWFVPFSSPLRFSITLLPSIPSFLIVSPLLHGLVIVHSFLPPLSCTDVAAGASPVCAPGTSNWAIEFLGSHHIFWFCF
jgi:hypothetical protein